MGAAFTTVPSAFELPLKLPEKLQPRSCSALAGRASPTTRTMAQAKTYHTMARMMAIPDTPLMSLMTLAS